MTKRLVNNFTEDHILNLLMKYPYGVSRKKIAEQIGINVNTMAYHWNKLIKIGYIKKIGYCLFVRGEKTSVEPLMNVHAMQLVIPIIKDESVPSFWDKAIPMKGWTAYYKYVKTPIGFTIQKNTRNVQIQVWARNMDTPEQLESLLLRAGYYAQYYLREHAKVVVDLFNVEKKNVDIAFKDNDLKNIVGTKDKIEIELGRPTSKLFESDKPKEAKAWYDSSPTNVIETNDIEYAKRYLRTPEMVTTILETQERFAKNLELHLTVLQELRDAIKSLKEAKSN